uniref:Uncharacterized protein n=1 Tax=Lepeophtheirus salmonis TaxID=72036 RepID=A0A0K2VGZ3_LEPSM
MWDVKRFMLALSSTSTFDVLRSEIVRIKPFRLRVFTTIFLPYSGYRWHNILVQLTLMSSLLAPCNMAFSKRAISLHIDCGTIPSLSLTF